MCPEPDRARYVDDDVSSWRRALVAAPVVVAIACDVVSLPPAPTTTQHTPVTVDCGSFDAGHGAYDAQGLDCFWTAYSAGKSATWSVKQVTVEGDPIPATVTSDTRGLVVSRDFSADKFSSQADRRVFVWTCSTVARKPWATDPSRYVLELTGCTGAGSSTSFP